MNKNDIFNSYSLKTATVEAWGHEVTVQELSAGALDKLRAIGDGQELRGGATVIVHGVIDENGKKVFAPNDVDKILDTMSVADINLVSEAILKVSGLMGVEEVVEGND